MKKGYLCPHCGNKETGRLELISSDRPSFPVLLAPQKMLRHPDVWISCSKCGWFADAEIFRPKKIIKTLLSPLTDHEPLQSCITPIRLVS
jgi:predicted RNA-binding Zn-ribbon protein involved in translation (DUF1610 family)